jgi:Tol biopolymer transport system component
MVIGETIGPYRVVAKLGEGGMGEVYRARDARLGRDVALKLLPDLFAGDAERLARFKREAQVLAALNHQNIAAIYGLEGDSTGADAAPRALVMELVEGPTLAERIGAGPIPLADALPLAAQIAQALEAAHDLGIVHRDLKPANIKLRPDGTIKVLDFGLAKIADPAVEASSPNAATYSPTVSLGATRAGMILGTAAYMAPEQARGRPVDKRADVWAFGAVLYEMLTGSKAFPGDDISDTLATVIKFEPDWSRLPSDTPPSIRRLIKRCLTKDPKLRLRDCGSALIDIHDAQSGADAGEAAASVVAASAPRRWLPIAALAALAIAGVGAGAWAVISGRPVPPQPQPTRRVSLTVPEGFDLPINAGTLIALSPDGRTLLFRADRGADRLWHRREFERFESSAFPGLGAASHPVFSPDGLSLIAELDGALKKHALAGGPPQTLATTGPIRSGDWGADGRIFVSMTASGGSLLELSASGGAPATIFTAAPQQRVSYPQWLPDVGAVLFTLEGGSALEPRDLHLLRLATKERWKVMEDAALGRVVATGHLIFVRSGMLMAVPFDRSRLQPVGTPVPVIEGIRVENGGAIQLHIAQDGTLAYIPGLANSGRDRRLAFLGADGQLAPLSAPVREYTGVALSPDGTRAAVQIGTGDGADVWVVELTRGAITRVTTEQGFDGNPLWSRDGTAVIFASNRQGRFTLNRRSADGTGSVDTLATFDAGVSNVWPTSWSRDGQTLVVTADDGIGVIVSGKGPWKPLIDSPVSEWHGAVSPDGRLIAYTSQESGTSEVYLQRFPDLGERQPVSVGGGYWPTWSSDGRSLFYLRGGPPRETMRVTVQSTPDGRAVIGQPQLQGQWRYLSARNGPRYYDLAADGRLLVMQSGSAEDGNVSRQMINVVFNWFEELRRLVPIPSR